MNYWLMKSEPSTFSIEALQASPKQRTCWDGVRNYQVRNMMRDTMKVGDLAFFYHSSCDEPGIAGIVKIVRAAYPDHTAFDPSDPHFDADSKPDAPRWLMVDVQLQQRFSRIITLDELRKHADKKLKDMQLLKRGNRLSITPVSATHWQFIMSLV
jgi:predicted RNA-binding protein with PUA-like domain